MVEWMKLRFFMFYRYAWWFPYLIRILLFLWIAGLCSSTYVHAKREIRSWGICKLLFHIICLWQKIHWMCHDFDTGFSTFECLEFHFKSFWSLTVHDDIYYTHLRLRENSLLSSYICYYRISIALHLVFIIILAVCSPTCNVQCLWWNLLHFSWLTHTALSILLHNARHGTEQHDKTLFICNRSIWILKWNA